MPVLIGEKGGCLVRKRLSNAVLYSQPDFFLDFRVSCKQHLNLLTCSSADEKYIPQACCFVTGNS